MIRILFVCHGNICRSPMAEFVMKHIVNVNGKKDLFYIDSKATSTEEIGNGPHHGTVAKLKQQNIPMQKHTASQLLKSDYEKFDFIIGMDNMNYRNMMRILKDDPQNKVSLLLDFTNHSGEIADPWYTGNFDETFSDIWKGCNALYEKIKHDHNL